MCGKPGKRWKQERKTDERERERSAFLFVVGEALGRGRRGVAMHFVMSDCGYD